MNQKQAKKLRKLAGYKKPNTVEVKGVAHGPRERTQTLNMKVNDRQVRIPISVKYQAVTQINTSKLKYNIAKKTFKRLKQQGA
jgi:hypothetical protein